MCQDNSKPNKQQQQQQNIQLYTFYCKLNVSFVTSVYMYMYIMGWYSRVIYCSSSSISELYTHKHYFVKLHNEIIAQEFKPQYLQFLGLCMLWMNNYHILCFRGAFDWAYSGVSLHKSFVANLSFHDFWAT